MIRTRWFVVLTIAVVAAIGALVYRDETARSEAALGELGQRQEELARIAALAPERARALVDRDSMILIAPPSGDFTTATGTHVTFAPGIARLDPTAAANLGLPARTAMVGIARTTDGGMVAAAASAEHQRDRDFATRMRVVLAMALAAAVMIGFTLAMWWRQRKQAALARDLAVAETARSRDAELDRLYRAATMAALGSGVAHELSTPLGVIVGRAEQLLSRVAGDERAVKNVQVILDQTEYINQVVRGLLGLARGAPIALQPTDADALVREATTLVQHRFTRANVTLEQHNGLLPEIRCEPLLFKH
ncbi:MAG TPA: histidine kinase dimerization/phospho-acceptor domain-containing protein, partial [Kofleriaceae bacterium]